MVKPVIPGIEELQECLRQNFKKGSIGFVGRLLGDEPQYSYKISKIDSLAISESLLDARVFRVFVAELYLSQKTVPMAGGSWGLFWQTENRLSYLDPANRDSLAVLLFKHAPLKQLPVVELLELVRESCFQSFDTRYRLLNSFKDLEEMAVPGRFGGDYRFNAVEFDRCRDLFSAPQLKITTDKIWLCFYVLSGSLVSKRSFEKIEIAIYRTNEVRIEHHLISDAIFTSRPMVMA